MTGTGSTLESELAQAARSLRRLGKRFALVGGLAVSIRGEVRFTRDVDLAVAVASDGEAEALAADLAAAGYTIAAVIEHEARGRLSIVRLRSRARIHVDLLVASSGIEREIVEAASAVALPEVGEIPIARAEDLLATKILSMSAQRPQDRMDARGLLLANPALDLALTRDRLRLIRDRGFDRGEDLEAKLADVLRELETA